MIRINDLIRELQIERCNYACNELEYIKELMKQCKDIIQQKECLIKKMLLRKNIFSKN